MEMIQSADMGLAGRQIERTRIVSRGLPAQYTLDVREPRVQLGANDV